MCRALSAVWRVAEPGRRDWMVQTAHKACVLRDFEWTLRLYQRGVSACCGQRPSQRACQGKAGGALLGHRAFEPERMIRDRILEDLATLCEVWGLSVKP